MIKMSPGVHQESIALKKKSSGRRGLSPSHEATGPASRELGQGGDKGQDSHFPMCFNLSLNKASSDTVGLVSLVPGRRRHLLRDQAHWVSEVPLRERE